MAKTVYVLGAGINRALRVGDFYPPLATDFFQQALRLPRIVKAYKVGLNREYLDLLFDYINKHWKLSRSDLEQRPFDLEACYTLIQLQSFEAKRNSDMERFEKLRKTEHALTAFLADYLSEFRLVLSPINDNLKILGEIIYLEQAAVLTFNYDSLLEQRIGSASGENVRYYRPSDEIVSGGRPQYTEEDWKGILTSKYNEWHLPLAYGIEFDWVNLSCLYSWETNGPIPKEDFYSRPGNNLYENKLNEVPFLKLHGSFNWIEHERITNASTEQANDEDSQVELVGSSYDGSYTSSLLDDLSDPEDSFRRRPFVITPVLHKDIGGHPFIREIWRRARQELSKCERLIVGGYSFPPTDFHTQRLFLEAFADHTPKEVVVINPDTRVVQLVKDLCHFKGPVLVCSNLEEFNALYP